jgi:hypothetical protein
MTMKFNLSVVSIKAIVSGHPAALLRRAAITPVYV